MYEQTLDGNDLGTHPGADIGAFPQMLYPDVLVTLLGLDPNSEHDLQLVTHNNDSNIGTLTINTIEVLGGAIKTG